MLLGAAICFGVSVACLAYLWWLALHAPIAEQDERGFRTLTREDEQAQRDEVNCFLTKLCKDAEGL